MLCGRACLLGSHFAILLDVDMLSRFKGLDGVVGELDTRSDPYQSHAT